MKATTNLARSPKVRYDIAPENLNDFRFGACGSPEIQETRRTLTMRVDSIDQNGFVVDEKTGDELLKRFGWRANQ